MPPSPSTEKARPKVTVGERPTLPSIAGLAANKGSDGLISLREAIDAANNTAALDVSVLANDSGGSGAIGLLELLAMTGMSLAAIARRIRRS